MAWRPTPWTSEEIGVLIDLRREGKTNAYIASQLSNRTPGAVATQCTRLGLTKIGPEERSKCAPLDANRLKRIGLRMGNLRDIDRQVQDMLVTTAAKNRTTVCGAVAVLLRGRA